MRTAIGRIAGPLRPPSTLRDLRPPRLDVDRHRQERVDQRDRIGAGIFGGARERGHVGDVRRQLRNHRQVRGLLDRADDVVGAGQAAAELDAAFLDVRARDVQLDRGDALGLRQHLADLDVFIERGAADVDEGARAGLVAAAAAFP